MSYPHTTKYCNIWGTHMLQAPRQLERLQNVTPSYQSYIEKSWLWDSGAMSLVCCRRRVNLKVCVTSLFTSVWRREVISLKLRGHVTCVLQAPHELEDLCHIIASFQSHMKTSCLWYDWVPWHWHEGVMPLTWRSRVTAMLQPPHGIECLCNITPSYQSHMKKSCLWYWKVMSLVCCRQPYGSHVTRTLKAIIWTWMSVSHSFVSVSCEETFRDSFTSETCYYFLRTTFITETCHTCCITQTCHTCCISKPCHTLCIMSYVTYQTSSSTSYQRHGTLRVQKNHRSLLQKSPIKETIFCKRDL